jgi:hypothetical protein
VAKKIRIRGKIRPLTRSFRPDGRLPWRKQKALAVLAGRRLFDSPVFSIGQEILLENGSDYLVIEASTPSSPNYIITE